MPQRQNIDPIPSQKGVSTYVPLQYQSTQVDILTGTIEWNPATTLTFYLNWNNNGNGQVQLDVPLFVEKQDTMTSSAPQTRLFFLFIF